MPDDTTPKSDSTPAEATPPEATPAAAGHDTPVSHAPPAPMPVPVSPPDTGYTTGGVPTLDGVREKIETRYGTALGATELAEETPEGRTAEQRYEARQQAAADKLEEIRASMHKTD